MQNVLIILNAPADGSERMFRALRRAAAAITAHNEIADPRLFEV